jgi:hypothetical protein
LRLATNNQGAIMRKTALLLLTVLGLGVMVWAQAPAGFKDTRTVALAETAKVGTEVLPAGEYKVTHVMEGAEHIMIFKARKQEYRIKCNMEPLNAKAKVTQFEYKTEDGQRVLESMVFQGDTVKHVIVQ